MITGSLRAVEHPRADHRMRADEGELVVRQRPGLAQDRVRDADLADVVQRRGDADALDLLRRQPDAPRDELAVQAHALRVAARVAIAHLERHAEAPHQLASRARAPRSPPPQPLDDRRELGGALGDQRARARSAPRPSRCALAAARSARSARASCSSCTANGLTTYPDAPLANASSARSRSRRPVSMTTATFGMADAQAVQVVQAGLRSLRQAHVEQHQLHGLRGRSDSACCAIRSMETRVVVLEDGRHELAQARVVVHYETDRSRCPAVQPAPLPRRLWTYLTLTPSSERRNSDQ